MISLNLLSPAEKKTVASIGIYHLTKNTTFQITSLVVIAATLFFFTNLLIKNNLQSLQKQISFEENLLQEGKVTSLDAAIKELNVQLASAKNIQSQYIRWTPLLVQLAESIPDPISVTSLQLDAPSQSFKLVGVAADRNSLLALQENLQSLPYLTGITSPISNLAQRENISFEVSGQLTKAIYE